MDLDIKKDSVRQVVATPGGSVPSIDTKTVKTSVLVDNDRLQFLVESSSKPRTDVTKVPLLGDSNPRKFLQEDHPATRQDRVVDFHHTENHQGAIDLTLRTRCVLQRPSGAFFDPACAQAES